MGKDFFKATKHLFDDPEFRKEYEALEEEFSIAETLIQARARAGLTQQQVAERMGTTQSAIARMESGKPAPSMASLKKFAAATGSRLEIRLEPRK